MHIHKDAIKMQNASIIFTEACNLTARNTHIYITHIHTSTTIKTAKRINYFQKKL